MSQPIITAKNISKKYSITSQQGGYVALRDVLTNIVKSPFSFAKQKAKEAVGKAGKEDFWALKNINFEVKKGEAIGMIGANGAGKSTLLKILTGITPPTTGEITMRGKVASLLEVGTGFHPELSGRENIFLNGAILGMTKKEIGVKFNDIIKFSGIEKFIDTPVKRYSSGMYVRLAFSVAAHMEPDILLVDEVLAVGDAEFQKKCLGKMDEVTKKAGRTILFVSHNMNAIQKLCKRCILLKDGKIEMIGETKKIIDKYLNDKIELLNIPIKDRKDRGGKGNIKFTDIKITNDKDSEIIKNREDIYVYLSIKNFYKSDVDVRLSISINTKEGFGLISYDSLLKKQTYKITASKNRLICKLYSPPLNKGDYNINIAIFKDNVLEDWIISATKLCVHYEKFDNHINSNHFPILSKFKWSLIENNK